MKLFIFVFAAVTTTKIPGISSPVTLVAATTYISTQYHSPRFWVAPSDLPLEPVVPAGQVLAVPLPLQKIPEVIQIRAKQLEALEVAEVRSAEAIPTNPEVPIAIQSISPVVAGLPTPLAIATIPAVAAKSSIDPIIPISEVPANVAISSPQASSTSPVEEPTTILAPIVETKSAILPEAEGVAVTSTNGSTLSVSTRKVRSFVRRPWPDGVPPILPAPTAGVACCCCSGKFKMLTTHSTLSE